MGALKCFYSVSLYGVCVCMYKISQMGTNQNTVIFFEEEGVSYTSGRVVLIPNSLPNEIFRST